MSAQVEQVEQLEAAVTALDGLDLDGLDDESLHAVTAGLQRAGQRLSLVAGRCLARWDARQVWAADQSRSAAARLSRDVNVSMRPARRELRRARRLGDVPATVEAVAAGRLSIDHVDLLARAQHAAPERFAADEGMLVGQCAGLRFPQAEQVVAYWRLHADPDGTKPADPDRPELHASTLEDGTVVINGTLDLLGGEIFLAELERLERAERLADQADGVVRTVGERRVAALVEMAARSAAMPPGARRPRPLFVVHVGDDTARHLCETAAARIVHPATLTRYFDDADMDVVLFDGPTTILSVSHRRSFTGAVRRAIEARDRHCQHPSGCDEPAPSCDVDHIVPWPDSQRTDQFNGRLECPFHNRHPDRHDADAQPLEPREITILDEIRARLRWLNLQHERTQPDEGDDDTDETAS